MTVVCNSLLARQGCFTETDGGEANQHRAKLLMSIIDDSQFKGPSTQMHKLHKHKVSYQCSFVIPQHNTHQNHINQIININYE